MKKKQKQGFTLIELLVVIAFIAILSIVVLLTVNPAELLRQSRDANRVSDLSTMRTALSLYLSTVTSFNLASSTAGYTACYLSTPTSVGTSSPHCGMFLGVGTTTDASVTAATFRKVDSTGWVPVAFNSIVGSAPFGALPVDPTNNATYYYSYGASSTGAYEVGAFIESQKYSTGGSNPVVTSGSIYLTGSVTNL